MIPVHKDCCMVAFRTPISVQCPRCGAPADLPCVGDGKTIHYERLRSVIEDMKAGSRLNPNVVKVLVEPEA